MSKQKNDQQVKFSSLINSISQTFAFQAKEEGHLKQIFGQFYSPPSEVVIRRIADEVLKRGGRVEDSTIIGFSAQEAGILTRQLLESGQCWAVKFGQHHM